MNRLIGTQLDEFDLQAAKQSFHSAEPSQFICIDHFLQKDFAHAIAAAYPSFEVARQQGREFSALNERGKVQVTDLCYFPEPLRQLNTLLSDPELLAALGEITGIPQLLADDEMLGGGMHLMKSRARLDVHADFNFIVERALHRRLNLLLFLNPIWKPEWGGELELWDAKVQTCAWRFAPLFNRCIVFATTATSFHGVAKVRCPVDAVRCSFAAYYYTREAPADWNGGVHTTLFRTRPNELWRGWVMMPAERLRRSVVTRARALASRLKRRLQRH
jgi:Rps23 Pro-64 3,4-dihydroxylase Tpa1-like proline 4-hydroxylase